MSVTKTDRNDNGLKVCRSVLVLKGQRSLAPSFTYTSTMVKQRQRTDRCYGGGASRVQFPVGPVQRKQPLTHQVSSRKWAGQATGSACVWPNHTEEGGGRSQHGGPRMDAGSGGAELKRLWLDRADEAAAPTNGEKLPGSCDQPGSENCSTRDGAGVPPPEQQGAADHSSDSRAAELQSVGSLKVTIQQSSESREFGQTDRCADRQTGVLHCHICSSSCRTLQAFQEHMAGSEHQRRLKEITHSICLKTHTLQDRGRRPDMRRWCDTCRLHFSGDVIIHRRTKQHKLCKQQSRPFCPVCKRHFRTPRKFVEHMKSAEHKQQVQQQEAQEEELITVDAVGCFEEEEEEEEEAQTANTEEYNPHTTGAADGGRGLDAPGGHGR
ncbi:hypothetical protein LDENG_00228810 [Lucifuga dentata]|nr:hypothetical protein LDENG_00228810 [Lucifuga dentata]